MSNEFPSSNSIVSKHRASKSSFRKQTKIMNKVLVFLYRFYVLPIFGIGKSMLVIETIGRRTGKRRRTPTLHNTFYTNNITLYSARGKNADWIRNIRAQKEKIVFVYKGFKRFRAKAIFVDEPEEKIKHLRFFCENYKGAKFVFGYNKKKHKNIFDTEGFNLFAQTLEFVQLVPL